MCPGSTDTEAVYQGEWGVVIVKVCLMLKILQRRDATTVSLVTTTPISHVKGAKSIVAIAPSHHADRLAICFDDPKVFK
jgi:hypothetical protein